MPGRASPGGMATEAPTLQIDTTHHKQGNGSSSYDNVGPHSPMTHTANKHHADSDDYHSIRRKKPKLYKPFNLHHAKNTTPAFLQVGNRNAPPPRTAPSLKAGGRERAVEGRSGRSGHGEERSMEHRGRGGEVQSISLEEKHNF